MVTIMTVEPGKGGQSLILKTIDKIKELKQYIEDNNIDIDIQADGGINIDNASMVKDSGANIIVSGTAIINSDDYKIALEKMR